MNVLVWPHLRYFLDHMMSPAVDAAAGAIGRPHFLEWVRACGPLPVVRVANQPYGLLPITPLEALQLPGDPLQRLTGFLHGTLRPMWRRSVTNVPRVSDAPTQAGGKEDHPLLTALSLSPTPSATACAARWGPISPVPCGGS